MTGGNWPPVGGYNFTRQETTVSPDPKFRQSPELVARQERDIEAITKVARAVVAAWSAPAELNRLVVEELGGSDAQGRMSYHASLVYGWQGRGWDQVTVDFPQEEFWTGPEAVGGVLASMAASRIQTQASGPPTA
ncbi:MAG: hypothetical protein M3072_12680 [Candidatus Dormibacteraeota bacterium]|nr:hypothetical protein [Candidatus Dormibacteraeota bacterium]